VADGDLTPPSSSETDDVDGFLNVCRERFLYEEIATRLEGVDRWSVMGQVWSKDRQGIGIELLE